MWVWVGVAKWGRAGRAAACTGRRDKPRFPRILPDSETSQESGSSPRAQLSFPARSARVLRFAGIVPAPEASRHPQAVYRTARQARIPRIVPDDETSQDSNAPRWHISIRTPALTGQRDKPRFPRIVPDSETTCDSYRGLLPFRSPRRRRYRTTRQIREAPSPSSARKSPGSPDESGFGLPDSGTMVAGPRDKTPRTPGQPIPEDEASRTGQRSRPYRTPEQVDSGIYGGIGPISGPGNILRTLDWNY